MHGCILIKGDWIPIFSFGHIEPKDDKRQLGGRGGRGSRGEKIRREGRAGNWRKGGGAGGRVGSGGGEAGGKGRAPPSGRPALSAFLLKVKSPSEEKTPSWEMSRFVLAGEGWSLSFQSINALGFRGSSHLVNVTLFLAYEWIFPFSFVSCVCLTATENEKFPWGEEDIGGGVDKRLFLLQTPFKTQRQSSRPSFKWKRDAESPYSPGNIRLRTFHKYNSIWKPFSRLMNIMESYKLDVFKM